MWSGPKWLGERPVRRRRQPLVGEEQDEPVVERVLQRRDRLVRQRIGEIETFHAAADGGREGMEREGCVAKRHGPVSFKACPSTASAGARARACRTPWRRRWPRSTRMPITTTSVTRNLAADLDHEAEAAGRRDQFGRDQRRPADAERDAGADQDLGQRVGQDHVAEHLQPRRAERARRIDRAPAGRRARPRRSTARSPARWRGRSAAPLPARRCRTR